MIEEHQRSSSIQSYIARALIVGALLIVIGLSWVLRPIPSSKKTSSPTPTAPREITFIGEAEGPGFDYDRQLLDEFTQKTGIVVHMLPRDWAVEAAIQTYQGILKNHPDQVDVFEVDTIWPGVLADDMIDLKPAFSSTLASYFPNLIENNTVNGKLVAIPYYPDMGVLFYRTDLLAKYGFTHPPQTWAELEKMAATIQQGERHKNKQFWGYVWQGNQSEILTCNALEWQAALGGGRVIEPNQVISVNNPQTEKALQMAKSWIGRISPPEVLNIREDLAQQIWEAGDAAFMRNWFGTYQSVQMESSVIKDKFGVALLPGQADTLGGWQLAISKYSKHQQEALELVKFLTSPEIQKRRALERGYLPAQFALYNDPQLVDHFPQLPELKTVLTTHFLPRPSLVTGKNYLQVSETYAGFVHQILAGKQPIHSGLRLLDQRLQEITGFPSTSKK